MTTQTLLAIDPGTNSFAYTVQRLDSQDRPVFLQQGFVHATVRTLTNSRVLRDEVEAFRTAIQTILGTHAVTHIVLERYMLRRGSGGTAIEGINVMIGILLTLNLPIKTIPASQWKNAVSRSGIDLEAVYAEGKLIKMTPHVIDAATIGQWGWSFLLQRDHVFFNPVEALTLAPIVNIGCKFVKLKPKKRKRPKAKT